MSKRLLYSGLLGMAVAPFFWIYGYFREAYWSEVRKMPMHYAYGIVEGQMLISFATEDVECLPAIYEFRRMRELNPENRHGPYEPPCYDLILHDEPVFVIEIDSTNRFAKIGHFYHGTNRTNIKYFEGYMLAEDLRDTPRTK